MKKIVIQILLLFYVSYSYAGIKNADTITPADLGAYKWILSETTQKDEVAIFQSETITELKNGKKYIITSDLVSYSPNKKSEAVILAYSPDRFLKFPNTPKWHIKIFECITYIDAKFKSCGTSTIDNSGSIEFKKKNGLSIKIKFRSFIIKIAEAKKRYKGLPAFNMLTTWRWADSNNHIEKKKKQSVAAKQRTKKSSSTSSKQLRELRHLAMLKAKQRMRKDSAIYSYKQLREIETLYQVANQQWGSKEAIDSLKKLVKKFKKANRTGCALLYLGQMSNGKTKKRYLLKAINGYSECYYGDGVQVGAYARYHLAYYYKQNREDEKAQNLFMEIKNKYPDAIDHKGRLLADLI